MMNSESDTAAPPLLAARRLSFARGDERIFGPLDLHVDAGEALLIEGGNGAGKTSLVRVLAGLSEPEAGEIEWLGSPLPWPRPPGCFALLGHHLGLKAELSALENLRFRVGLDGLRSGAAPMAALHSVGLEGYEALPLQTLSAGQRKRVALAALLLNPAPMWLLDEPYANLDRPGQVLVDRMLEAHCRRGGAALLTSHGLFTPTLTRMRTITLAGVPA